jgi:predicted transcriptional regulator of viral defense system
VRKNHQSRALEVARAKGLARTKDFDEAGVPRPYLKRLCDANLLVRHRRGLYQLPDASWHAAHDVALVAKAIPSAIIALVSALQFYELTTQLPRTVWVLLDRDQSRPKSPPVGLTVVRASGASRTFGVERHVIEGVEVPFTSPAKTVADCFKYRRVVGMDVAVEALRDALRKRRTSYDSLIEAATVCRMLSVMRPFLEFGP